MTYVPLPWVPRSGFELSWADICNKLQISTQQKEELEEFMTALQVDAYEAGFNYRIKYMAEQK